MLKRALVQELTEHDRRRKIYTYYPAEGPLRRELYPKHLEFFRAGLHHRERLALAANRVGKTEGIGGYETTLHLTGLYPDWWEGRRFNYPIRAWAAGDTSQTVRDIIQAKLLGPPGEHGTGLIPYDCILSKTSKSGVPNAVQDIQIRHETGGISYLTLKSYDQRRESFQGTEQDLVWLDEECPIDIYSECLIRTMTTNGLMILTFTPLSGITDLIKTFLPDGEIPKEGA